jgi:AcrR family transcriptional regulator
LIYDHRMAEARMAVGEAKPTPSRLLDATVRLIGREGVDAVSIRAINAEAASNVAAVHYHFGSKEALVATALERQMEPLAAERYAMLAPLEGQARPAVRAIAEVVVLPLARLAEGADGLDYVRFLAALDRAGGPWRALVGEAFAPQWDRLGPVLARATPATREELRAFRFSVAATAMLGVLADPQRFHGAPRARLEPAAFRAALIDTVAAILAGPRPPTHRRPA